jgi:flavodoxin
MAWVYNKAGKSALVSGYLFDTAFNVRPLILLTNAIPCRNLADYRRNTAIRRMELKILVTYFTQTGNTEKIAKAIHGEMLSQGNEVDLKRITEVTAEGLNGYDLVFLGSACHDTDLAKPVKRILEAITQSPPFRLAGFVTHATYMPEGGERQQAMHEEWAGRCVISFEQASQEKEIEWCGYFSCQGAPSPPIEAFIRREIVTEDDEWEEYIAEVRKHPDENDMEKARQFARECLSM